MFYWELVKALPKIIAFLEAIERAQAENKIEEKVAEDAKKLKDAFAAKDAKALRALFNSK
jgi:hypothetical protein